MDWQMHLKNRNEALLIFRLPAPAPGFIPRTSIWQQPSCRLPSPLSPPALLPNTFSWFLSSSLVSPNLLFVSMPHCLPKVKMGHFCSPVWESLGCPLWLRRNSNLQGRKMLTIWSWLAPCSTSICKQDSRHWVLPTHICTCCPLSGLPLAHAPGQLSASAYLAKILSA